MNKDELKSVINISQMERQNLIDRTYPEIDTLIDAASAHLELLELGVSVEDIKALVEARKAATQGEWEYLFHADVSTKASFIQKSGGLGVEPVICRISNNTSGKDLTDEDFANGDFITTAANIIGGWGE